MVSRLLVILLAISFAGPVAAIPIVYSGYDAGSTSLAGSPNATAAATAFDLATGSLQMIDFESALPSGVGISGGFVGDASNPSVCFDPALHCYATSPVNVYRNNGATFTFANPIDSFGAYFTGWQLAGQTINIGYLNGSTAVLAMQAGNASGGTLFFGLTDFGSSISSIEYISGTSSTDAVGIDDVRFGTAVPEPATIILMGLGLASIVVMKRKAA